MSIALKFPEAAPTPVAPPPIRFSETEQRLRIQFVAAFNDARQSSLELYIAVRDVTDELKRAGEMPEGVIKRIKYIAAIPIAFHYRAGYKGNRERLSETRSKAISLSVERYFLERKATATDDYRLGAASLDG
ncbi:MAG TPA: hypothetical protein VF908_10085 [Gemmatimonadaceae bacterium]